MMDRDDYKSAYDDLYALHDEALTKLSAAEARIAALTEAGQRLRDFVESGDTSCGYSSAPGWTHGIFGEEATNTVLAWDNAALPSGGER